MPRTALTTVALLVVAAMLATAAVGRSTSYHRCSGSYDFGSTSDELPPVHRHDEGGFFRQISEHATTCGSANKVVAAYITEVIRHPHIDRRHIPAHGFVCRVYDTDASDEQDIRCSAPRGRGVRFHQGS